MRQTLMAVLCALAMTTACGDDEEKSPGADFVGTWTTTTAVQTVEGCIFPSKKENLSASYTVAKTDGADVTITSSLAGDCPLKANAAGSRVNVIANQTCTRTDGQYEDRYTYATSSTIDLAAEGGARIKLEATFQRYLDGLDTGYSCGFTEEAPIKK